MCLRTGFHDPGVEIFSKEENSVVLDWTVQADEVFGSDSTK